MFQYKRIKYLIGMLSLMILISLACSQLPLKSSSPEATLQPTEAPAQVTAPPAEATQPPATVTPPLPPAPTPIPATLTLPPVGSSRSNPYPANEVITIPDWEIQILEMQRGEQAWLTLEESGPYSNLPAPPGYEYLLLHLRVRCTATDNQPHDAETYNYYITGDRAVLYSFPLSTLLAPEPWLTNATLNPGEEMHGWEHYTIGKGESNLILVIEKFDANWDPTYYYIAIEPGARVQVPEELASIPEDELGSEPANPAPGLQPITAQDWQVTVLETLRGEAAEKLLTAIHPKNQPLFGGMEYLLAWVKMRYIGNEEEPQWTPSFKIVTQSGQEYEDADAIPPSPSVDGYLYAGGETQGWIVMQTPETETNPILIFFPEYIAKYKRYLSLDFPPSEGTALRIGQYWLGPAVVEVQAAYESGVLLKGKNPAPEGQKYILVNLEILWVYANQEFRTDQVVLISESGQKYHPDGVLGSLITVDPAIYIYFTVNQAEDLEKFRISYEAE